MNRYDAQLRSPREQRLLRAMLLQGIDDARSGRTPGERRRARAWICAPGETRFSFRWACDRVGLDPDAAQEAMRRQLVRHA